MIPSTAPDATRPSPGCWLRGLDKLCRKCAVEMISKRQRTLFFVKLQHRQVGQNLLHDLFVFFRLESAGAVDEHTTRFQQRNDYAHNLNLPFLHAAEISGR